MAVSRLLLDYLTMTVGSNWIPIVATIDCDYYSIYNTAGGWFGFGAQAVTLRRDLDNVLTSKPLPAGAQEVISAPYRVTTPRLSRFLTGDILVYIKADSGTAEIIVTFLR